MARKLKDIYNEIVEATQAYEELETLEPSEESYAKFLSQIKTNSTMGIWRAIAFVVAVYHWLQEIRFDDHIEEIELRSAQGEYGTAPWYERKALEYQHGDIVTVQNGKLVYPVIDESKQIVTVSAVRRVGGSVEIKVAKGELTDLQPLSFAEKAGIDSYFKLIRPVGDDIILVSEIADQLKIQMDLYYNATAGLSTVTAAVEAAINDYLANLQFAGVFVKNTLIDRIQAVKGVVDVQINTLEAKPNSGSYVAVDRIYESVAGYMAIDSAFPLNTEINYIAN